MSDYDEHIRWLAEWLGDPRDAEPCAAFPVAADRGAIGGVYAWHGDEAAAALVSCALGPVRAGPLYFGRTNATLNARIVRNHLRNTKSSTLRRSLAVLLWDDLDLRCTGPNTIDAESNIRLTQWMLEHLSVAIVPILGKSHIAQIEGDVLPLLDPPLNIVKVVNNPGRTRLRALRRLHLAASDVVVDLAGHELKIRAAEASDPGVVVPISRATGKGSRRSRARSHSFWTPADAEGGA
jgi:hypothetical protein